ncbi:UvrD-helicase domain-containing protein [Acholeplasma equifetale]|uniref:UvrD-helicase domain-containing protein n=1 Tax=Acholeplasma equifetale TaxID=264634 RepID=UPI00138AF767|nr:UvrD-helicase domain-containing protein [Acholeplasma equifetale]
MRLYYNPELLFKGIPNEKHERYYKKILQLVKAIEKEKTITQEIINQYKFKKMKGTESIFKFYIDNQDGARCLCKYEEKDDQIFENEKGLILLQVTSHESQGELGKFFDSKFTNYMQFLTVEDDKDDAYIGNDSDFNNQLGRQFLRTYVIQNNISDEQLLEEMSKIDHKAIYKLSNNQLESINIPGPVFLMGSAGSGKTLVEISKALKNAHSNIHQAYFTYTKMLKESAEKLYKKYSSLSGIVGKTSFYIIKNFMMDTLGISESQYMSLDIFLSWMKSKYTSNKYKLIYKIDPIDLWSEIRGLIKGYSGHDRYRILEFSNNYKLLSPAEIELLLEEKYIERIPGSNSRFYIKNSIGLASYCESDNPKFHQYLINQDIDEPLLDRYSYVYQMKSKYTRFNEEERAVIYDFVLEEYQKYLKDNDLFDDNDLARLLIKKIYDGSFDQKFDYLLIDEIQDLTEIQILSLVKLVKNSSEVFMSGDVSQVINPTFFHDGRMGVIFKHHFNQSLNDSVTLRENYRNSENIINVLDELLAIRRKTIGKYSYDIEEEVTELEKREGLPVIVKVDKDEMLEIMSQWIDVPNVAIIVSNDNAKKSIKHSLGIKGETNLYTVQEIKGQEFEKIIAYNIASDYAEAWEKIMNQEIDKGSEEALQYRFYFNTLYVAITRGRINLYLYEDNPNLKIIKQLSRLFEEIKENAIDVMNITGYDTEENRRKQAETYFNQGDYKRAFEFYTKINNRRMMQISTAFSRLNSGNSDLIEQGLINLVGEKDYEEDAYRFTNTNRFLLFRIIYGYRLKKLSLEEIKELLGDVKFMDLVQKLKRNNSAVLEYKYKKIMLEVIKIMSALNGYKIKTQIYNIKRGKLNEER